jgi:hypothetical protein
MVWAGGHSLQREENSKRRTECGSVLSSTVTVGDGQKGNGFKWDLVTKRVQCFSTLLYQVDCTCVYSNRLQGFDSAMLL